MKIKFKNFLGTIESFFRNDATVPRNYQFQDRDGTISDDTDLASKQDKALPIESFTTSLLFDSDDETFQTGGSHSFTLQSIGNVNGVGKIVKLNNPVSASFSSDFILVDGSNPDVSATKLNIIVMLFQDSYNGAGSNKVLYKIIQQTSV